MKNHRKVKLHISICSHQEIWRKKMMKRSQSEVSFFVNRFFTFFFVIFSKNVFFFYLETWFKKMLKVSHIPYFEIKFEFCAIRRHFSSKWNQFLGKRMWDANNLVVDAPGKRKFEAHFCKKEILQAVKQYNVRFLSLITLNKWGWNQLLIFRVEGNPAARSITCDWMDFPFFLGDLLQNYSKDFSF